MREYILTANEKAIIQRYLETGERLEGYAMLVSRCRNMGTISSDLELIKRFIEKVEGTK